MKIVAHLTNARHLHRFFLYFLLIVVSTIYQIPQAYSQTPASDNPVPGRYGPIKHGDSLSGIAQTLFPDSPFTREQLMWAIYKHNPNVFMNHDVNKIMQGMTLRIPEYNQINATDPVTARQNLNGGINVDHDEDKALNNQLKSTRQDIEAQQHERDLLKAQLVEMEKQVQQLIEQNREKDAELQDLDVRIRQ